jgi:hypothetical protein
MPTSTTNYGLIKPDTTDPILIGQLNDNSDAIDAALKENADAIENKPDAADIPTPSTAAPAMDGTAAAGTSTDYARADHVHPSDTSKQDALTAAQLAAVNSGINSEKVAQYDSTTELEAKDRAALVELVDSGAKNLLDCSINALKQRLTSGTWNNNVYTNTAGDISMTVNSDNTLTISATNVTTNRTITIGVLETNQGNLYFSCTPNIEGAGTKFRSGINYVGYDDGEGLNVPNLTTSRSIQLEIIGSSASPTTLSNIVYKPMLCTKAAWDVSHSYQPYRPSYQELYERVVALEQA